jgi:hypothetical protein
MGQFSSGVFIVKVTIQVQSLFTECNFLVKDKENYTLEYPFQHMPGSLPGQSLKMNSSQPELNDNWTKISYKRGRPTQKGTEREAKHAKESEPRKANTGSTKLPLPPATQLYWKRKVMTNRRKLVLGTRQNLL